MVNYFIPQLRIVLVSDGILAWAEDQWGNVIQTESLNNMSVEDKFRQMEERLYSFCQALA